MVLRESFHILEEFETKVGVQVAFTSEVFGTQVSTLFEMRWLPGGALSPCLCLILSGKC